jgi:RNA polymerase sigma-70 factor (ECF subfamily)
MSRLSAAESNSASFPTTHWSRVAAARWPGSPEGEDALAEICRAYWYPLYAFARRKGLHPQDASDAVQGLFAKLLEKQSFRRVDQSRGRFRSYLMTCCSNYINGQIARENATKRGGGKAVLSIDRSEAEFRFGGEPGHEVTAERLFERRWALTVLDRVIERLDAEMATSSRPSLYRKLRPSLLGEDDAPSYREVGDAEGMSEGAVKVAAHRIRLRYRDLLRGEVSRTILDPGGIEDEIAALLAALGPV